MAERRMFAKTIVLSDAFLDMPLSARCLYFTLGMFADDDGFVGSPKAIMRQCGASQDDMLMLIQKRFILAFDSGIIVIKHWRINNYLRNDRYQKTIYTEEKEQLVLNEKNAYTEKNKESGIPSMGIPSIGKDSIDKDSIDIISAKDSIDYQIIVDIYHYRCPSLPKVTKITDARKKLINARLKDYSEKELEKAFMLAEESDFLTGRNGKWGGANFDWIMNTNNIVKILEGNYRNKTEPKKNEFKNYQQSNYDWDEINKELGIK